MSAEHIYQGTPCKRGHDGRRYSSTGTCVTCSLAQSARFLRERRGLVKVARRVVDVYQEHGFSAQLVAELDALEAKLQEGAEVVA